MSLPNRPIVVISLLYQSSHFIFSKKLGNTIVKPKYNNSRTNLCYKRKYTKHGYYIGHHSQFWILTIMSWLLYLINWSVLFLVIIYSFSNALNWSTLLCKYIPSKRETIDNWVTWKWIQNYNSQTKEEEKEIKNVRRTLYAKTLSSYRFLSRTITSCTA